MALRRLPIAVIPAISDSVPRLVKLAILVVGVNVSPRRRDEYPEGPRGVADEIYQDADDADDADYVEDAHLPNNLVVEIRESTSLFFGEINGASILKIHNYPNASEEVGGRGRVQSKQGYTSTYPWRHAHSLKGDSADRAELVMGYAHATDDVVAAVRRHVENREIGHDAYSYQEGATAS